jgi:chromosome partitioning protein
MSNVIAILNQKGGVGKTTTAINLGAYLARAGKSVLIIDFDPQGNATSGMGLDKHKIDSTSYEVLLGLEQADKAIHETDTVGLNILPTNENLAAAEIELVNRNDRELLLKEALANLNYDFILIDCPPALGLLTLNALADSGSGRILCAGRLKPAFGSYAARPQRPEYKTGTIGCDSDHV